MDKKEEVIKTSRELFSEYGFKKVTMDQIAQKSNVTKRTIYKYFKDKDELIKYFLNEEIENMKKIVKKIEKENISAKEKVHKLIYELLDYKKEAKMINKFTSESMEMKVGIARQCIEILNDNIRNEIKILLEKGIKKREIKNCNTQLMSFLIYRLYVSLMFEWNKPLDKNEVTKQAMKFLNGGLFN